MRTNCFIFAVFDDIGRLLLLNKHRVTDLSLATRCREKLVME